jgi:putative ABC transport system permease protein
VLLASFAVAALLVAAAAVYGVVAHSVVLRRREMGLRMALGAQSGDVLGLVVRQGLLLALVGAAAGLAGALAATRLMAGLLYRTEPLDPATFAAVACVLIAAGAAASYLPARRATRADPMVALKK